MAIPIPPSFTTQHTLLFSGFTITYLLLPTPIIPLHLCLFQKKCLAKLRFLKYFLIYFELIQFAQIQ